MKFILPLLFATLTGCASPARSVTIDWQRFDAATVAQLCDVEHAQGCARKQGKHCTMYTVRMPMEEFTSSAEMNSWAWRTLAHEVMHCFGYEHYGLPTPK